MGDELKRKYEKIYKDGKESFFSIFEDGENISETEEVVWSSVDWNGKRVIDIGCGTGEVAAGIAKHGAEHVLGVDYATTAIEIANQKHYDIKNLEFQACSLDEFVPDYEADVVISLGTLEHMDDPNTALHKIIRLVRNDGKVILTCPYFINVRGLVWMTLALALDVPMSLTDKHFISPFDIKKWLHGSDYALTNVTYFDHHLANGDKMLIDMEKRLHNALRDAELPVGKVPELMGWLTMLVKEERSTLERMNGACALYLIEGKGNV
ncbi:uncharacterized protein METZ01_LOCUS222314 [marine metagenome]|uniref:Methyltransferase type 11 domain-containing protein n=1 Tax=marine metagenome TaxID=408172 RepID=A0A382G2J5_9ZZZZ